MASYASVAAKPPSKSPSKSSQNLKQCSITKEFIKPERGTYAKSYYIINEVCIHQKPRRWTIWGSKPVCVFPVSDNLYVVPKIVDEREIYLMVINHLLKHLPYEIVQMIVGYLGCEQRIEYLTKQSFPFSNYVIDVPEKYRVDENEFVSIKTLMTAVLLDKMELAIVDPENKNEFNSLSKKLNLPL